MEIWKYRRGTVMVNRATGDQISITKFFQPRKKVWTVHFEWTSGPKKFKEEAMDYPIFRDQFCLPTQKGTDA